VAAAEIYCNIDFDEVLAQLAGYAQSELTASLIRGLDIVFHPARIEENLDQTAEALHFLENKPSVQLPFFSQLEDLTPLWERMSAGELIDSQEARAMKSLLEVTGQFTAWLTHLSLGTYPRLSDVAAAWQPLEQLSSLTRRLFSDDGEVRDAASKELNRIRNELRRFESQVGGSISEIISTVRDHGGEEGLLTIRGNRFVVLIPRDLAGQFKGNIVDVSGSGQSIYFEPSNIAAMNTERQHLFLAENQEVRRILRDYSMQVASQHAALKANLAILVKADYIFARARYARALRASRPILSHDDGFNLRGAVHPLLYKDFIPEDLTFNSERCLVISGVNAGGKTVLLKLVGIYSLMATIGCYLPGEATMPYISGLRADIGDDQSALSNLSTFTAHLQFVSELWLELASRAADDTPLLVLIDEIGTGTEPGEGAAFAYGLISALLENPVKLVVTTHYDVLKTLAFERDDVKNISLEFDQERLAPTFRILDDQPGQSFALAIAKRWGIDPAVLATAASTLGEEEQKMAAIIGELEGLRRDAELTRAELRTQSSELVAARAENEELTLELRRAKQQFASQADRMKVELQRRIDELLSETKRKLRNKARQSARKRDEFVKAASKSASVARHQKAEVEEVVEEIIAGLMLPPVEEATKPVEIAPGDTVAVSGSAIRGEVIEQIPGKGEAVLSVMGKRVTVKLAKLTRIAGAEPVAPHDPLSAYRSGSGRVRTVDDNIASRTEISSDTLDLHGYTIEEATERLEEFISSVLLAGVGTIRVMHGVGTGRLRAFVQGYLNHHGSVTNVRQAGLHDGGVGITLADLK
jgi:DNA mismatch repair protein MutS2